MTIYSTLIRLNNMYMYVCSNTSNNIIPWEDGFNLSIVVHIILNLNPSSTCIVCGLCTMFHTKTIPFGPVGAEDVNMKFYRNILNL
jgi:hypothetical protein